MTLKAEPARQLVDNADLSWTWSVLRVVFVLKASPSWLKLKRHEWKRLWGFTAGVLFNKTNKKTNGIWEGLPVAHTVVASAIRLEPF